MIDLALPYWHPIFVNFPVAFLTISTLLFLTIKINHEHTFYSRVSIVAYWCLWIGSLFAIIAVMTGFLAFYKVIHLETAHIAMLDHRNFALITLVLFLFLSIWSIFNYREHKLAASWFFIVLLVIGFSFLVGTGYRGGRLVFVYGVGVQPVQIHSKEQLHLHGHSHQ